MDPGFFLPCFHGPRTLRLGHKRKKKTHSVHNLLYRSHTQLIRGIYEQNYLYLFFQDSRFNQEIDKKTGYRTRSILCMPIQDHEGEVQNIS